MIDLEGLAGHRGSAFGWVGQQWEGKHVSEAPEQPRTEHFVNLLAIAWRDANRRGGAGGDVGGGGGVGGGGVGGGGVGGSAGGAGEGGDGGGRGWLFIEDEDTHIGGVTVPASLFAVLRCAPLVVRAGQPTPEP